MAPAFFGAVIVVCVLCLTNQTLLPRSQSRRPVLEHLGEVFFWVPASAGVGAVNTIPQVSQRSRSISYPAAEMGGDPEIRSTMAGVFCARTLPLGHWGQGSPDSWCLK